MRSTCLIDFNVPKALGRNSRVLSSQRLCLARVCPQPLQHSSSPAAVRLGTQMVCSSSRMLVQIFQMVLPTCPTYIGPLSATSSPFHQPLPGLLELLGSSHDPFPQPLPLHRSYREACLCCQGRVLSGPLTSNCTFIPLSDGDAHHLCPHWRPTVQSRPPAVFW